jgi:MFS family permease
MSEKPDTGLPTRSWRDTFTSLKVPNFRYLWLGVLFMMGGMQMQGIARGYLTYELTSSPVLLGLVSAGFAVPMLCLALFGGAIADRFERRRIIQACQGLGGITSLAIAISISTGAITWVHLLVASFLHGIIFSFMMPSRTALIPQLVSADLVTNALALNAAAMSSTTLLAPALAGNLYNLVGPAGVYYIISALEFAAVVFTGMIRGVAKSTERRGAAMMEDIVAGLQYVLKNPLIMVLLVMGLATALLAMPIRHLLPVFVVDVYGRGPAALGLLVSVLGLGALVGSLAIATMGQWRRGLVLILGGITSGVGLLLIGLIPVYSIGAMLMVLLGLGDAARRSLNMALLLEITDAPYRGRVSSIYMMNFGLMPLGILPAGVIAEYFGGQAAAGTLAIALLIICLSVGIFYKPLRRMR